jgi:hypothetical protein
VEFYFKGEKSGSSTRGKELKAEETQVYYDEAQFVMVRRTWKERSVTSIASPL